MEEQGMLTQDQKVQLLERKQRLVHQAVPMFEDAPRYELEGLLKLHEVFQKVAYGKDIEQLPAQLEQLEQRVQQLVVVENAPERIYLWKKDNMPSLGTYTENEGLRYNHDPDFEPYMYELLVSKEIQPKGAVVVCAGGDHGDCTLHEGYQTCLDFNKLGYQCFLLLNRTNHCPYASVEAGADAARAIQYARKHAKKYRIDENRIAFAGFSNGGLTGEACIQFFSGTQTVSQQFEHYIPDELDEYYASPDANICVYGPRFPDATFDYTNVVYPPTFFAVGRDDSAMKNLNATVADLLKHNVEVEIHTFSGVPHGQSGVTIYGENKYPHFQLWLPLADVFMQTVFSKSVVKKRPDTLHNREYRYDSFSNGKPLLNKKKGHLPTMGWNSWNAFGSGNTEHLTKEMADAMVRLGLDQLGYQYVVLDDGCYRPIRVEGKLANEEIKFPSGFKALGDYIHNKGLKYGMYNDIGTNLCAGAAVGTCGHEDIDAQCYIDWGVDFLKVDNCYYLWDNATFSDATNAKYVYAPNIKSCKLIGDTYEKELSAVEDGMLYGNGIVIRKDYVTNIGTFDGTGPQTTPVGLQSGELHFHIEVEEPGTYELIVEYATAMEPGVGSWLQVAVGEQEASELVYDDFMPASKDKETFVTSKPIKLTLAAGNNVIRLMNHRRQENTLSSYAALLEGLNRANPDHDIIFSICEWGKTQPQNWGYKVGDSWRILNDITFQVGADGYPGKGDWVSDYTTGVTSQYNKAVIMDEFAGLDKGYNDPDMLMIGMNGLTETMCKTHMTMWCMMNAPLMLGLDLRRVNEGDAIHQIIANDEMIALNQDPLGIACKRIFSTYVTEDPSTEYIRDNNRLDIVAKPLSDGSVAISFMNLSDEGKSIGCQVTVQQIITYLGHKMVDKHVFENARAFHMKDLWSKQEWQNDSGVFQVSSIDAFDSVTIRVTPIQ